MAHVEDPRITNFYEKFYIYVEQQTGITDRDTLEAYLTLLPVEDYYRLIDAFYIKSFAD